MSEQFENIAYAANEKLLILGTDLRVINASPSFYKAFMVRLGEPLDVQLGELGEGDLNDNSHQPAGTAGRFKKGRNS